MDILTPGTPSDRPKDNLSTSDSPLVLALTNLSESLASAQPTEAFEAILDFVDTFISADACFLTLLEPNTERLSVVASRNLRRYSMGRIPCLGEGLIRAVLDRSELLCIDDISADPRDALGSLYAAGYCSTVITPLIHNNIAVGTLGVLMTEERKFTVGEVELIVELAQQASAALNSQQTRWTVTEAYSTASVDLDRYRRTLRSVGCLSDSIISATTMEELLQITLVRSLEVAGARIGSLMLYDNRTQVLNVAVSQGLDEEVVQNWGKRRIGEGLAGWVAQNEKPLLLREVNQDPRADPRFRKVSDRDEITSALLVPLRTRSRLIGVLNLARSFGEAEFDEQHIEVMETVANQIAIAIERMRLHQEIRKRSLQLSTLMEVGKTITSMLDIEEVTEQIAVQLRNLARAKCAFLFYYDPVNDLVRQAGHSGCPESGVQTYKAIATELALHSARLNRYVTAADITGDVCVKNIRNLGAFGWGAVPFRQRGQQVAIGVVGPKAGMSMEGDVPELLEQFGTMAAVAIQNAKTYNREHSVAKVMGGQISFESPLRIEGVDIAHRLVPRHEVGGDYYDFITLGDRKLGIVIADVSGSSLRAAAYTTLGKHALRAYAREYENPAEVLTRLNSLIYQEADSEIFISLFYGTIDIQNRTLTYAMAGHEPPLLLSHGIGRIHKLYAPGMLLGVSDATHFECRTRSFKEGDMLALYTDGLTEAPFNKRIFGLDRLKKDLRRECHRPLQEIVDTVMTTRMRFSPNFDDIALVLVKS